MSFTCGICKTPQKPYVAPMRQIMELRTVYYQPMMFSAKGYYVQKYDQPVAVGYEIVHEENLCEDCVKKLMKDGFAPKVVSSINRPYLYTKKKATPFVKKSELDSDDK